MNELRYILITVVETLLRVLPFPSATGLRVIGNPDEHSPVLLTGNYHLTVERVRRALRGLDCYLLIANSRGINVWCAAAGGHLTNHDVISALKTSGIEQRVAHRRVILPQLAATGVEASVVQRKTGWKVVWGPVYAGDIPAFINHGFEKSPAMRQVTFPWTQRLEMVAAWAFPISIISALAAQVVWPDGSIPLAFMVWGLALVIFLAFPLYSRWLRPEGKRVGFVFFDFGRGGLQLILWGAFLLGIVGYANWEGTLSWDFVLRWGFASLVVVLVLSLDLMGSTPVYKSGLHEDRLLEVILDENKCRGAGFCEQVCPRNCFDVDHRRHLATRPRGHLCVQCGACIVQCPFDALTFQTPTGETIAPETIRKFKLNLLGQRLKGAGSI